MKRSSFLLGLLFMLCASESNAQYSPNTQHIRITVVDGNNPYATQHYIPSTTLFNPSSIHNNVIRHMPRRRR